MTSDLVIVELVKLRKCVQILCSVYPEESVGPLEGSYWWTKELKVSVILEEDKHQQMGFFMILQPKHRSK